MSFIEQKSKWNISNLNNSGINDNSMMAWSSNNFYRTSYNDMSKKASVERKNAAIPGYKGFIPGMKNQTLFGKSFTEQTRDILKKELIDDTPNLYQSTGFNASKLPKQDQTLDVVSRNYGKRTMMHPSPAWWPTTKETTTQESYKNPFKTHYRGTWRTRQVSQDLDFDSGSKLAQNKRLHQRMYSSGFQENSLLYDGTTWETEKNLHTDQVRTIYRNLFNVEKPFHKTKLRENPGRPKRKILVYDKEQ